MKRFFLVLSGLLFIVLSIVLLNISPVKAWGPIYSPTVCELDTQTRINIEKNLALRIQQAGLTTTENSKITVYSDSAAPTIRYIFAPSWDISYSGNISGNRGYQWSAFTNTHYTGMSSDNGLTFSLTPSPTGANTRVPFLAGSEGCIYYSNNILGTPSWAPTNIPEFNFDVPPNYDDIIEVKEPPFVIKKFGGNSEPTYEFGNTYDIGLYLGTVSRTSGSGFCAVPSETTFNDFKQLIQDSNPHIIANSQTVETNGDSQSIITIAVGRSKDLPIKTEWNVTSNLSSVSLYYEDYESSFIELYLHLSDNSSPVICQNSSSNTAPYLAFKSIRTTIRPISTNIDIEYPQGYSGEIVPNDSIVLTNLKPEFFYTVNKEGLFNLQFGKNLPHFLTGTFYTNLDKMNTDWEGLDTQVTQFVSQPAGEMNESYELPGAGYYMINISHNQQLDNPPWIRQDYFIQQVFMQFYWNGSTPISGNNSNCFGTELCNPWKNVNPNTAFGVQIQDYGLVQAIYAPLNFISTLPSKMASDACQPLILPLPYMDEDLVLPCMRPIYETHFSPIYNLYSAIAVGLVSYYLGINLFSRIKKDVSPTDDSIEVAKL